MIVVVGLITAKNAFQKAGQRAPQVPDNTSPAAIPPSPSNPKQSAASSSPEPSPSEKAARPKAAFSIKIGDKIDDGVPGPGAGAIETPYGQDAYIFTAAPGQRVYFRMLRYSTGMSSIRWRLVDGTGAEIFSTCLGCSEPGVQTLIKGGIYTLTFGTGTNPSTGSYGFEIGAR